MLFNFTKFVEWPATPGDGKAPLDICVFGRDPFGAVLDQMVADRTVSGRRLKVQRGQKLSEMKECQVLFVAGSESRQLQEVLQAGPQAGVLTVSDAGHFAGDGGIVGMVMEDNRVRFEVNLASAERAKLRISARLLQLARAVHRAQPGEVSR